MHQHRERSPGQEAWGIALPTYPVLEGRKAREAALTIRDHPEHGPGQIQTEGAVSSDAPPTVRVVLLGVFR